MFLLRQFFHETNGDFLYKLRSIGSW